MKNFFSKAAGPEPPTLLRSRCQNSLLILTEEMNFFSPCEFRETFSNKIISCNNYKLLLLNWRHTNKCSIYSARFNPVGIYLLKVNNRNTRTRCEICSKLTIKTPERRQLRRSSVFIVNFEHISHLASVSIVNFEHVIADWEPISRQSFLSRSFKFLRTHILKNICKRLFLPACSSWKHLKKPLVF